MADWTQLAQQLRAQAPASDWDNGGIDRADELAQMLWAKGVRDLSQMRLVDRSYADPNFFRESGDAPQQLQGQALDFGNGLTLGGLGDQGRGDRYGDLGVLSINRNGTPELGWSSQGHGAVGYQVQTGPDGRVQIVPAWASSSDMDNIRGLGMVFGGALAGSLGAFGSGVEAAGGAGADAAAWSVPEVVSGGAGTELGTTGVNAMRAGEIASYGTSGAMPSSAATVAGGGGMWDTVANWAGNNWQNIAGSVLGAATSRDQQKTDSRDPWGPAQPFLRDLIGQGQTLSQQYQAQPFNPLQQQWMNRKAGLLDSLTTSALPGLLSGLNTMNQGYQRPGGPSARQSAMNYSPTGLLNAMGAQNIDWNTATPYRRGG